MTNWLEEFLRLSGVNPDQPENADDELEEVPGLMLTLRSADPTMEALRQAEEETFALIEEQQTR